MNPHSFGIYFLIKKKKLNKHGLVPIHVRITINSKTAEISIKRHIDPISWSDEKQKAKGNIESTKSLNNYINNVKNRLLDAHSDLIKERKVISALSIKRRYLGEDEELKTLLQIFKYHNTQMRGMIGKGATYGNYKNFITTLEFLKEFILLQYKTEDYYLKELKYKFIADFEYFLRTVKGNKNGASKHIQRLKKVTKLAVQNEWLDINPFAEYSSKMTKYKPTFLDNNELQSIEEVKLETEGQRTVRDIFVFSCYSGFAYADVAKLKPEDLTRGIDGELWIYTYRTKTEVKSNVPLLPKALEIVYKYKEYPVCLKNGKLLPTVSNQKTNQYLKEIASQANVSKNLTFHVARHTFATTVTLNNDVPIESVSKMLGHSSIKQTQEYAKVLEHKVSNDMNRLKSKLTKNESSMKVATNN